MNLRALTRGDAAVAGAAVLLLVASFLPYQSVDAGIVSVSTSAWATGLFPVLPSVFLLGLIAAGLILVQRLQGEAVANRQVLGLRLDQWGTALAVAALWTSVWSLAGGPDVSGYSHGFGAWLAVLALLVLTGAAAAGPLVPALQAPLLTDKPATPQQQGYAPYTGVPGAQPGQPDQYGQPGQPGQPDQYGQQGQPGQYGYPGAQAGHVDPAQAHAQQAQPHAQQGQPQAPYGAQQPPAAGYGYPAAAAAQPQDHNPLATPAPAPVPTPAPAPAAPAAPFAPFWFAVPAVRQLTPKENPAGAPVGELVPGTWYLAVEQVGAALVAQLPDGSHGLLADTSGIQRG
ncbi:hypothetical protein GCM10010441_64890 [Kitasatospora paracochleata]|uniref:Integral membrane protein n=1 Tax=Kitasatospora paracochleata TaxID=58354 RepID=A0ABT1IZQ7_9ACTN|nr:hypothetical protein [Kitasatospora paracochleata]MCP2310629.1 hypothetical protein [Kitasatospora paracochleata]